MMSNQDQVDLMFRNSHGGMIMESKSIAAYIMKRLMQSMGASMDQPALREFVQTAQQMESKNENSCPLIFKTLEDMGIPYTQDVVNYVEKEYAIYAKMQQAYHSLQHQKQQHSHTVGMKALKSFPFQSYIDLMGGVYDRRALADSVLTPSSLPAQPSSLPVDTIKKLWENAKGLIKASNRLEAMNLLHKALFMWIENQPTLSLTKNDAATVLSFNEPMVINGFLNIIIHNLFRVKLDKKDLRLFIQILATHALNLLELTKHEYPDDAALFYFVYSHCIDWLKISARVIRKFNIESDKDFIALLHKKQLESEFIYAVMERDFNQVQNLLLTDDSLVNRVYGYKGQSCVMAAIITPGLINFPLIQLLIDNGADLFAKSQSRNGYGFTALHYAVSKDSVRAIRFLVKAKPELLNTVSAQGISPLLYAISVGHKSSIEALVKLGANPQEYIYAAKKMNIPDDIVKFLKAVSQKKANRTLKKFSQQLAREEKSISLRAIPQKKDAESWQTALDQGNYYFENDRYVEALTAFTEALAIFEKMQRKMDSKLLVEHYQLYRFQGLAALKSANYSGAHLAFTAADKIKKQIASMPNSSAVADIPDIEGVAFLSAAAAGNQEEAETILDEYKGNQGKYHIINATGQNDMTPLMIVAAKEDEQYFTFQRFLVETVHADLNATDADGRTVLHQSAIQNRLDNIGYFLAQKGRIAINQRDDYGRTALHYATEAGFHHIVAELLRCGAQPDIRDHDQKSALDLCKDKQIKQLFLDLKNKELEQKEARDSEAIVDEVFKLFNNGLVPGTNQYYRHSDKIARAEKTLSGKVGPNSTDIDAILRLSEFYRHTKMVSKQGDLVFDALKRFPDHVKLLIDAAYIEKFVGNPISAKSYFRKAQNLLSAIPDRNKEETKLLIIAIMGQVRIYFTEKCYNQIILGCKHILSLQPNHTQATTSLASVQMLLNQPESATKLIATITDKENPYVQSSLMQFYFHASEYRQAITIATNLLQTTQKKSIKRLALFKLAQCYDFLKEKSEAKRYYQLLLKEFPEDFHGKMCFLVFNCKTNKLRGSDKTEAAKNMTMQFPFEHAYLNYARELWYAKQYFASIELYEKTAKLFPQSIRVHIELVQSYVEHGFIDRAIFHAEHFLGISDHSDKIDLNLGNANQTLFPNNPYLQYAYINALFANGDTDKATQYSISCIELHCERPWAVEEFENILYQNNITPPSSSSDENESKDEDVQTENESALNSVLQTEPGSLVTPSGILRFFLNGNAEKTYQYLVKSKHEATLFPEVLRTQLTHDEISSNHAWVLLQLRNIDIRVNKGRSVSINEIYFILLMKEVYPWAQKEDKVGNIFAMVLEVAERYKFQCDESAVLPSDKQGLGLLGYVYSRARFKQPSLEPLPIIAIKPRNRPPIPFWSQRPAVQFKEATQPTSPARVSENKR